MPAATLTRQAPVWVRPEENSISLNLRTITPLFGGGYEPGVVDGVTPIRAAAIRGQLRFWWRAVAGACYETHQRLFDAEEAIWGSASKPGTVAVIVRVTNPGTSKRCARFELYPNSNTYKALPLFERPWPSYALQAFQGKLAKGGIAVEREPEIARLDCEFTVILRSKAGQLPEEVLQAAAAWIEFGGVGARTRRGCGSLERTGGSELPKLNPAPRLGNTTAISGAVALEGKEPLDPIRCWAEAVSVYRDFRQGNGIARTPPSGGPGPAGSTPGRSYWPEPGI